MLINKHLTKYLKNYAEAEVQLLTDFPKAISVNQVIVIPAYKESIHFIERFFDSALAQLNTLMICVINQPTNDQDTSKQEQLYNQASAKGIIHWEFGNLRLLSFTNSNSYLLLIDRYKQPIPEEQGVGLARKIGADIATYLIATQQVNSQWIYSSDADAHLPNNYFTACHNLTKEVVAVTTNFRHQSTDVQLHQANNWYEKALRYYVNGLKYSGSHYAFFTIGSLLIFNVEAYVKVRGFPKKSAGEDFYLLNKIAKLGQVDFIEDCVITLEARNSDRVPFGTGPAVNKIMQFTSIENEYCYYQPVVFDCLKICLQYFTVLWQYRENMTNWYELLITHGVTEEQVTNALKSIGFEQFVQKQIKASEIQFNKQLQVWFDAFKTLKFIHALREAGLEDIPLKQALLIAKF